MIHKSAILTRIAIAIIFIMVFTPFVPLLIWSVSHRWAFPNIIPDFGLRAWKYVFTQRSIAHGLITSVLISLAVTCISLVISMPAAKVLGTQNFKGKRFVEMIITLPAIVPILAVIMGIQFIFIKIGLINTYIGVVIVQLIPTMPYMVMYLQSTFQNYSLDFESQARVLGASPIKVFYLITIPIIWPGIVVAALYTFLVSWSQYLLTIMIGGPVVRTLPTLLFSLMGSGDNAVAAAVSIVFILPAIVLLILTSKYFAGTTIHH